MPSHLKLVKEVISLGWERYGGQNLNLGSHPFLESVFLTCGASKCLGMHTQAIIHPCLSFPHPFHSRGNSLKQQQEDGALSLMFGCRFSILACPEIGLGYYWVNVQQGWMIWGFLRDAFGPPHAVGACWEITSTFFYFFIPRFLFMELCSEWAKETHDLGMDGGRFSLYNA